MNHHFNIKYKTLPLGTLHLTYPIPISDEGPGVLLISVSASSAAGLVVGWVCGVGKVGLLLLLLLRINSSSFLIIPVPLFTYVKQS